MSAPTTTSGQLLACAGCSFLRVSNPFSVKKTVNLKVVQNYNWPIMFLTDCGAWLKSHSIKMNKHELLQFPFYTKKKKEAAPKLSVYTFLFPNNQYEPSVFILHKNCFLLENRFPFTHMYKTSFVKYK